MTNREILLEKLKEMDNKKLSETIDLECGNCPAKTCCCENADLAISCQNTIYHWLNIQ